MSKKQSRQVLIVNGEKMFVFRVYDTESKVRVECYNDYIFTSYEFTNKEYEQVKANGISKTYINFWGNQTTTNFKLSTIH